ncbi:hypothetical protein BU23DRAFT_190608 [Bimuria novae-zelandiae CBS 107.79]|uniref:Uncharacterized protein n=1 Tax=Bimuria novae-zelandiae CBS 107.79 TaxID=1447943 RepID=A0A6A5VNR9_9PLEO|nr:hypothetical protein BU23DRAFT_190608 [Bimuria novae-zelandiae CBS 107.79]
MKTAGASDLPLPIRALIVEYRLQFRCSWVEISQKLGCHPWAAQKFYERTRDLANTEDLHALLSVLDPIHHHGPQPFIAPGSEASKEVRSQILHHNT